MKYVKMLGLAAVAATALMAFVGAGTASAEMGVLCEVTTSPCPAANKWAVGAEQHFTLKAGTMAILKDTNGFQTDECSEATVLGDVTNVGSATTTPEGTITKVSFGGPCKDTTVVKTEHGTLKINSIKGTNNGTVTATGVVVTVFNTLLGLTCNYTAGTGVTLGTYTPGAGGLNGILKVAAVVKRTTEHSGSAFCPETSNWNAEYQYTAKNSTPLYITTE